MRVFMRDLYALIRQLCILVQYHYESWQMERMARYCNRFIEN